MYELVRLTERDLYIDCPAKIGVVLTGADEAVLIDSGSDRDAGKKVLRVLEGQGWKLKAIFNTHSHADHIGGNRFLQEKTGCRIYARGLERACTLEPLLEPAGLYGGLPFKALRHKFLMAQGSDVLPLTEDALPPGMSLIPLPGHSPDMTGFLTAGGTAYIADSVFPEETLRKYGISYLWDPSAALKTLSALRTLKAERFVPSHAPVTDDIGPLAARNEEAVLAVRALLLELCREPSSFEELLERVCAAFSLTMTAQQYALIGSTVRSYLSDLCDRGEIGCSFSGGRMLWTAAQRGEGRDGA